MKKAKYRPRRVAATHDALFCPLVRAEEYQETPGLRAKRPRERRQAYAFAPGGRYRFWYRRQKGQYVDEAMRVLDYVYREAKDGCGVTLHLFESARGGWLEAFTPMQLGDFRIRRVVETETTDGERARGNRTARALYEAADTAAA